MDARRAAGSDGGSRAEGSGGAGAVGGPRCGTGIERRSGGEPGAEKAEPEGFVGLGRVGPGLEGP